MEELIQIINSFQELDVETGLAIKKSFVEETFKKDQFIIVEGKICDKIYFIKSGAVRRFYIEDGEEVTKWIYTDNQFVTSMSSFFEQKPSYESFQTCEEQFSIPYLIQMSRFYWNIRYL